MLQEKEYADLLDSLLAEAAAGAPLSTAPASGASQPPDDGLAAAEPRLQVVRCLLDAANRWLAPPAVGDSTLHQKALPLVTNAVQLAAELAAAAGALNVELAGGDALAAAAAGVAARLPAALQAAIAAAPTAPSTTAPPQCFYTACVPPFAALLRQLPGGSGGAPLASLLAALVAGAAAPVAPVALQLIADLQQAGDPAGPGAYGASPRPAGKLLGAGAALQADALKVAASGIDPLPLLAAVRAAAAARGSGAEALQLLDRALSETNGVVAGNGAGAPPAAALALVLVAAAAAAEPAPEAAAPSASSSGGGAAAADSKPALPAKSRPGLPPKPAPASASTSTNKAPAVDAGDSGFFASLFREPSLSCMLSDADRVESARAAATGATAAPVLSLPPLERAPSGSAPAAAAGHWPQMLALLAPLLLARPCPADMELDAAIALLGFLPSSQDAVVTALAAALSAASARSAGAARRTAARLLLTEAPLPLAGHAHGDRLMRAAASAALQAARHAATDAAGHESFVLAAWAHFAHGMASAGAGPANAVHATTVSWLAAPERLAPLLLLSSAAPAGCRAAAAALLLRYLHASLQGGAAGEGNVAQRAPMLLATAATSLQAALLLAQPPARAASALAGRLTAALRQLPAQAAQPGEQWRSFLLAGPALATAGRPPLPPPSSATARAAAAAADAAAAAASPFPVLLPPSGFADAFAAVPLESAGAAAAAAVDATALQAAAGWLQCSPLLSGLLSAPERGAAGGAAASSSSFSGAAHSAAGLLSAIVDRQLPSLAGAAAEESALAPESLACLAFCTQIGAALAAQLATTAAPDGAAPAQAFNGFGSVGHAAALARQAAALGLTARASTLPASPADAATAALATGAAAAGPERAPAAAGASPAGAGRVAAFLLEGLEGASLRLQLADLHGALPPMLRHQFSGTSASLEALLALAAPALPALDAPSAARFVALATKLLKQYTGLYTCVGNGAGDRM